jgi:hypothetical protein
MESQQKQMNNSKNAQLNKNYHNQQQPNLEKQG